MMRFLDFSIQLLKKVQGELEPYEMEKEALDNSYYMDRKISKSTYRSIRLRLEEKLSAEIYVLERHSRRMKKDLDKRIES